MNQYRDNYRLLFSMVGDADTQNDLEKVQDFSWLLFDDNKITEIQHASIINLIRDKRDENGWDRRKWNEGQSEGMTCEKEGKNETN